jgi:hypothetical protein
MKTLIQCAGVTIGEIWVPPFQLQVGDVVCLKMPCLAYSEQEKQIVRILTGELAAPTWQLSGKAIWADPDKGFPRSFIQKMLFPFFRPRFSRWLEKTARFSREQTKTILEKHGIGWHWRLGSIPWTSRNLIALEETWAKGADIVVFSAIGLDPKGRQAIYREIEKHLHHSAAIELSFVYWTNGQQKRDCYPGAICLDLPVKKTELYSLANK